MMKLLNDITLLAEVAMNTTELMKPASGGPNANMPRTEIFLQRVKNGEPFELNNGKEVKIDAKKSTDVLNALRTGDRDIIDAAMKAGTKTVKPVFTTTDGQTLPITAFKKARYFGGGGGGQSGGAEKTDLRESSQAYVCAHRVQVGEELELLDLTPKELMRVKKATYDVTSSVRDMNKFLQEHVEANSAMLSANAFMEKYSSIDGSYVWHRGSSWVKQLETLFNRVNKNEGRFFININKWSPADIWCVKRGVEVPSQIDSFQELNAWANKMFDEGRVYGISLKMVRKVAHVEVVNDRHTNDDFIQHVIAQLIVSKSNNLFGSKDAYIVFESELTDYSDFLMEKEVQYRSFGGDDPIQGQIVGTRANHGKIGHGPTNKFLERLNLATLTPRNDIYAMIDKSKKDPKERYLKIVQQIINMAKVVNPQFGNVGEEAMMKYAEEMTPQLMVSKYQAVELMKILAKAPKAIRNKFVNNVIGYAGSATELSAKYIKIYES